MRGDRLIVNSRIRHQMHQVQVKNWGAPTALGSDSPMRKENSKAIYRPLHDVTWHDKQKRMQRAQE